MYSAAIRNSSKRRGHAAFQHDRFARSPCAPQESKILHVARADLDAVGVIFDQIECLDVDGFGDDAEPGGLASFGQQLQSLFGESLKRVGRSSRLVGAAAQQLGSRGFDDARRFKNLLAAFDRTRARRKTPVRSPPTGTPLM